MKPRTLVQATLGSARNEFEAFQVAVTGAAKGVRATATALTLAGGAGQIPAPNLYRVELINLQNASSADGGTGQWPDALVPDVDPIVGEQRNAFPFDVDNGVTRTIYVEYHVPAGTPAGTYHGQVTVSSDQGTATVPVTFEVWDFDLPSTASLRSAYGLAWGTVRAAHGVSGDGLAALRALYGQSALDHRISLSGIDDDDSPGDMNHFDQFYGPLMDGKAPTQLQGAKMTALKYMGDRTSVDQHAQWATHFHQRGWFEQLFDYTCDEPPLTCQWSDITTRANAVHQADPNFRTLVTTQVWDSDANNVTGAIDIMVPNDNFIWDKPGQPTAGDQRSRFDPFLASGKTKELWLYQSCMAEGCGGKVNIGNQSSGDQYHTGWATYVIDANATRNRAHPWLAFIERGTGELYWETTQAYTHDPWSNQWDFGGNGDGTLFYPGTTSKIGGKTDIPVASLRLALIRDGQEDYEYLKLVSDGGDPAFARSVATTLFPSTYQTDIDPANIAAARASLAKRILQLHGKPIPASLSSGTPPMASVVGSPSAKASGGCGSSGSGSAVAILSPALFLAARRRTTA